VAEVVPGGNGGDILVLHAKGGQAPGPNSPQAKADDPLGDLLRRSGLSTYRFERSASHRREILGELHRAMCRSESFSFNEVAQRVAEETHDSKLSSSLLAKYQTVLWQSKSFIPEPDQGERTLRERQRRLRPELSERRAFIANYEHSILYKVRQVEPKLERSVAAGLLGLRTDKASDLAYCDALLTAESGAEAAASVGSPDVESEFAERFQAQFSNAEDVLSRGRLLSGVRRLYAGAGQVLGPEEAEIRFNRCVELGLVERTLDGVTRVYRRGPAS
jgi:hypothetical protein